MTRSFKYLVFIIAIVYASIRLFTFENKDTVHAVYDKRINVNAVTSKQIPLDPLPVLGFRDSDISSTPIPFLLPISSPSPFPTPTETFPSPTQQKDNHSGNSIIDEINVYRASKGKSPLQVDGNTCNFANVRAQEVSSDFSHNGFYGRHERNELPYPSYTTVSENVANAPAGNPVTMWIASPTHEANLVQNVKYGCVAQSGNYYVYEGWTP